MKVIESLSEMHNWSMNTLGEGSIVGLVPTMGYLHEGHLSLIRTARKQCDKVVVSIYVNPAQFAPGEDLQAYPRDLEHDLRLCEQEGVSVIFHPSGKDMYAEGHKTFVITEELSGRLCGITRPIHFRGVTTIVAKLFNIVEPDIAVFGQKDAQQAIIIRRMVQDLNFDVDIIIAPTVRENDGLAMSSRNKYLTSAQRREAPVLFRSLQMAEEECKQGGFDPDQLKRKITDMIRSVSSAKIDYVEIVNTTDLTGRIPDHGEILIAVAAFFGKARLIDNIIIEK